MSQIDAETTEKALAAMASSLESVTTAAPAAPAAPPVIDLAKFDLQAAADAGAVMPLLHPVKGTPMGATFTVLGSDSLTFLANVRKLRETIAQNLTNEPTDPEQTETLNNARMAAAATTGWSGWSYEGESPAFTTEDAVRLYVARPWIASQINFFRNRRENFFKD